MLKQLNLPSDLALARTTPTFETDSVPRGLLKAHQIAPDVWGVLRVLAGSLEFTLDGSGETRSLVAGEHQVIPPELLHHVARVAEHTRFHIEFYS
ncbi:MAG: DUF1971 domain-containing protein [Actinobacteria bacterium]|nr:DUF1971 domain-containing protein [Actinomycetota bacterium]